MFLPSPTPEMLILPDLAAKEIVIRTTEMYQNSLRLLCHSAVPYVVCGFSLTKLAVQQLYCS